MARLLLLLTLVLIQFSYAESASADCNQDLSNELYRAVLYSDAQQVSDLINRGAPADGCKVLDRLPIQATASTGDTAIASILLANGANINRDAMLLCKAIDNKNFDFVKFAVGQGFTVQESAASLACAVRRNNIELATFLIEHGSEISYVGKSPLGYAIKNGNFEMVQLLLRAGANPSYSINIGTDFAIYSTPLVEAIKLKKFDLRIVQALIDAGAKINWSNDHTGSALENTLLTGNDAVFDLLVSKGVRISQNDVIYLRESVHIARELVKRGLSLNVKFGDDETLLFETTNPELIEYLVSLGVGVNSQNRTGQTAFFESARGKYLPALKKLIDLGADLNISDRHGDFAFVDWAMQCKPTFEGSCEMWSHTLKHAKPFNVDMRLPSYTWNGMTPLMYITDMAWHDLSVSMDIIKMLVERGANVNATDKNGKRVLEYASQRDVREYLISKGAH